MLWARGIVALPGEDWWIGAAEHSALNGERSAVFWALSWILGVHSSIPCFLHCDCIVAAFQAAGTFGSPQCDQLAVACRSIAHVLEVLGKLGAGTIQHVKGTVATHTTSLLMCSLEPKMLVYPKYPSISDTSVNGLLQMSSSGCGLLSLPSLILTRGLLAAQSFC